MKQQLLLPPLHLQGPGSGRPRPAVPHSGPLWRKPQALLLLLLPLQLPTREG